MDITNIPQNLIKALEQKNTDQLAALSRVLNMALGKTVMASVTSTAPVVPAEREELLKQTASALAQLTEKSVGKLTPAVKTEIARLMQQQNLIQSPELKWINLVVNNRPLLTYSDRPLLTGQTVPVQLQGAQKLVLLDLPEIDPKQLLPTKTQATEPVTTLLTGSPVKSASFTETKSAQAVNELLKSALAELAKKALITPAELTKLTNLTKPDLAQLADLAKNEPKTAANLITKPPAPASDAINKDMLQKGGAIGLTTITDQTHKAVQQNKINFYSTSDLSSKILLATQGNSTETTTAKNIVSEQLRNTLPLKDAPNFLLSAINQLQQLPATVKSQLFSPTVEQALKSLAEKIRSPEQLAQAKTVAQTIKNSGVFFENKLNDLAVKSTTDNHITDTNNKLNNVYTQDLKGSLLTLLTRVTQELAGTNKPVAGEQILKLFQGLGNTSFQNQLGSTLTPNNKVDISQNLGVLVQELLQRPVKELSDKELRTQLLMLLQQHSVHSLAKIQLQQLHSLNHALDTRDTASPSASWQLEIPIKHQNDVQHVHVRIDREWIDEKKDPDSSSEKSSNKIKQWSVTLRFDLPTLGEFCAQLAIVNTQVSATLWAAHEKTFTEVREHVEGLRKQLESEGISVKYLHCMRGMPPQKPMALSYSLIDIST